MIESDFILFYPPGNDHISHTVGTFEDDVPFQVGYFTVVSWRVVFYLS